MRRLQYFIDSLEDFELLAFYKYRFESFMKGSQEKILKELDKRDFSLDSIDTLIVKNKKPESEIKDEYCPRCYSKHFYLASEKDNITISYATVEINNRFKTCLVCLYSQEKAEFKKERRSIWNIFGALKLISKREK
ncbi:MAG: hypothetical protein JEY96_19565 [Bacteroidales bacterium]|nr:hypothetical protein [Bacteroidales bacterium]